ncbi:MAG: hypothetical protein PHS16_02755 [Candidatus Colwellbacteria bacterium]|jgi:hypothetical protein|nr:hypothetical protein [Candidatus Colwellbacteria bacterium]MCK9497856.1 hypothetical protein [Candidatus Colwellbacteria bacterium]MDD3752824.1 hypothetical protein [Candidatus Colwellbacteria bacterium]MDD4818957.1 hypothetical protein [Candidatus Colwellbacteria bacterium]
MEKDKKIISSGEVFKGIIKELTSRKIIFFTMEIEDSPSIKINFWKDAYESGSSGISYEKAIALKTGKEKEKFILIGSGWETGRDCAQIRWLAQLFDLGNLSILISEPMKDSARKKVLSSIISEKLEREFDCGWNRFKMSLGNNALFYVNGDNRFVFGNRNISRFGCKEWDSSVINYVASNIENDLLDEVL